MPSKVMNNYSFDITKKLLNENQLNRNPAKKILTLPFAILPGLILRRTLALRSSPNEDIRLECRNVIEM